MDFFKKNKYGFRVLMVFLIFLFGKSGIAQTRITGKIINEETKEEIKGAEVILLRGGNLIRITKTDINGNYKLNVDPGTYEMEFSMRGFPTESIIEVIVVEGQNTKLNIQLLYDRHMCGLVTQMRIQLARFEKLEKGQVFVEDTFKSKPNREISETITMTPGVTYGN